MYQMIGGDNQEYGPLSVEQLREYIAAGRANGQTQLKKEGEADFKALSTFPEFNEALAAKAAPGLLGAGAPGPSAGAPSVSATGGAPEAIAQAAIGRNYEVNIGLSLGRAWDLLKSDFWPIIGISALVLVVMSVAAKLLIGILLNGALLGGLFAYYLRRIRGQEGDVSHAFSGFSQDFLQLLLGGLITTILIGIGLVFCVVPGIYLGVAWQMTYMLIIDKKLGFWDAMEVSRKVISKNWWGMFALLLVSMLLNLAGVVACGVGVFVTLPIGFIALACVYEDLFGEPNAELAPLPVSTPPLSGPPMPST